MNRNHPVRKWMTVPALLAAALLAGCASYPYHGGDGVYYGKTYDRYDHHYRDPYGYTSYRYNYYRYDYGHGYRPWHYGYGSYYAPYRYDRHDHDHDRDRDHDTAGRSGDAAEELRRVTDQQRRRALLDRDDRPNAGVFDRHRLKQEPAEPRHVPDTGSSEESTNRARSQLRANHGSRPSSRPTIRSGGERGGETRSRGGIRMPDKRDR